MEFYSIEMALAIAVGFATLTSCLTSMFESRGPPAPPLSSAESSSAPEVKNPGSKSEDNEESVHSVPWKKYDVFLSFRGVDTRRGFVSHLYHELTIVRRIETFKDDRELEFGDSIGYTLLKAIEDSHLAIVVLSKNYAQSAWCLEELTKICDCMKDDSRIIPIFYDVQPTDVRHQTSSFEDAFKNHEIQGRHNLGKIQQWRKALEKVANITGCNANDYQTDRKVIEEIVKSVCRKVQAIGSYHIISERDFEQFEVTREAMGNVSEALRNENVIAVGVHGISGIGKTTMVEHVAVIALKQGIFRQVTMAVISQNPNYREIQARLAFRLGMKLKDTNEFARACALMSEIRGRERILIILDDIWTDIKLSDIGIPSLEELKSRNSKILLTSRYRDVCDKMQCEAKIPLNTLNVEDSWRLFEKNTVIPFEPSQSTEKSYRIAKKIAAKCDGLPLALKAVARALRGKNLDQWIAAAMRLKASETSHPEDEDEVFKKIELRIKLSYDYLESNVAKSCFLLCCLFPENYDIQIEDLLKYGIGKGLFQVSKIQEARASICSAVQSLKDYSLLLDGKMDRRYIRMHGVIRDVGLKISLTKDGHRQFYVGAGRKLKNWPKIDAHKLYTAISLMRNKIVSVPGDLVFPELQILLLQSNCDLNGIPESFFQHLVALKVLDVSHTRISILPSSSSLLTGLHTLCLDHCLLIESNTPILGQLKQLMILSMRGYPCEKLPTQIRQLTKLKLLDFTSEYVRIVPSEVICNLSELEELYMQSNFVDWGRSAEGSEVKENIVEKAGEETNAFFCELTSLLHLRILKVFMSNENCMPPIVSPAPNWKTFDICIGSKQPIRDLHLASRSSPVYSRVLTLDTTMGTLQKWFIDVVTRKTEKLQFIDCRDLDNILTEYDLGRLQELKYLSVIGRNRKLKVLMNTTTGIRNKPVFQSLEELHLDNVDCLEKLCVDELPSGSLWNLRILKVRRCHKLINALHSNLLQRLQSLEKLSCEVMDELKYVFSSEGSEPEQNTLPKLKEMRLDNLVGMTKIWNGPAPCGFFNIKILVVLECNQLKHLFTSVIACRLNELEDLSIEACRRLERVIEASEETVNDKIVLPKLKKLALKRLSKLRRFYGSTGNVNEVEDDENIEFPLLEHSDVDRCNNFNSPARKLFSS